MLHRHPPVGSVAEPNLLLKIYTTWTRLYILYSHLEPLPPYVP